MGESTKKLLHCYNKGCGKTFEPDDNPDGDCIYHNGEPYFHDAYKEWTCCKRKSTDFTEFLNIKGCTQGVHNGVRPKILDKPKPQQDKLMESVENTLSRASITRQREIVRLDIPDDLPLIPLIPEISARLLQQFSTLQLTPEVQIIDGQVPVGTICKNSGCNVSYDKGISHDCIHHPGSAIFHEGLKYWSCCRKITSDFSKFLEQAGCTTGQHLWFKKKGDVQCRVDWHQTGGSVVVSIFAKNYDPYKSPISLSPTRLKVRVFFPKESQEFQRDYQLYGAVAVEKSSVSMLPTKVEIKLSKAVGETWADLCARPY